MTRTANARIAGFAYLFYIVVGICGEVLMHQARGAGSDVAKLARIAQHTTSVRLVIIIVLLECFSALVLAVTLYGLTREEDHELAMMVLVFRVAEGILGASYIHRNLGLLWLAHAAIGTDVPDLPTATAMRSFLMMPVPSVPVGAIFFAVGSLIFSYLLLRGRMVPLAIAWLGLLASGLLVIVLPLQLAGFSTGPLTGYLPWLPALVFELALAPWLLIKGVRPEPHK